MASTLFSKNVNIGNFVTIFTKRTNFFAVFFILISVYMFTLSSLSFYLGLFMVFSGPPNS